ncbi:MAG: bifunctional riboflavin kinase/FAD synthetase, partial [Beijerinckiaceae bacterium]
MTAPFETVTSLADIPSRLRGGAVAIGNFDGVHRGHQQLLSATRAWGSAHGRPSLLLTFEPHPRAFFRPEEPFFRLTPPAQKARRAALSGIDGIVACPFDAALVGMSAEAFCEELLKERLGAAHVVTGGDFHFGKGRGGDAAALAAFGATRGFSAEIVPAVVSGGAPVSSTRIRTALAAGDIAAANALLGWEWSVEAIVMNGDKR